VLSGGGSEAFRVYDEHAFMSGAAVPLAEPLGNARRSPSPAAPTGAPGTPRLHARRACVAAVLTLGTAIATVLTALAEQRLGRGEPPVEHTLARGAASRTPGAGRSGVRAAGSEVTPALVGRTARRTRAPRGRSRNRHAERIPRAAARLRAKARVASRSHEGAAAAAGAPVDTVRVVARRARGEFGFER
jgi:hypothetical protein